MQDFDTAHEEPEPEVWKFARTSPSNPIPDGIFIHPGNSPQAEVFVTNCPGCALFRGVKRMGHECHVSITYNLGNPMDLAWYYKRFSEQIHLRKNDLRPYILDVARHYPNLRWGGCYLRISIDMKEDMKINVSSVRIERLGGEGEVVTKWKQQVHQMKERIKKWNKGVGVEDSYAGVGVIAIAFEASTAEFEAGFAFRLDIPLKKSELELEKGEPPDLAWAEELADWLSDDSPDSGGHGSFEFVNNLSSAHNRARR